jgi:hypothetical protein
MSENRQLHDAYRQRGFIPRGILRSVYFDAEAFGLRLARRRKKRSAAYADSRNGVSTISEFNGPATSTVRIGEYIWSSSFEGFCAEVAGP